MTDRELLELAAKAAGLNLRFSYDRPVVSKGTVRDEANYEVLAWENWNPLTDKADAFLLAFVLGMDVDFGAYRIVYGDDDSELEWDGSSGDINAALEAITRAAAEIGRAMG